jgi:tripartite-type tricarboxylate transporter receptor subunit TctC
MSDNLNKLIISADAGSLFDKVGQAVKDGLQRTLGHPVSSENVGDSGGVGGATAGAKAPADGSTIIICNKGAMTSHPHLHDAYRTEDFAPLCKVAEAPIAVTVGKDSPYKTLADLFDAARAQPDTISYSTPNAYHTQRLAMSGFEDQNGIKFKFIVLGGGNAASINHLNDGTVHFAFLAAHNLVEPEKAGDIRILGVAHGERLPFLPHVPTFKEQGFDLVTAIWLGLFAPVGVSAERLAELKQVAEKSASAPETAKAIAALNVVPAFLDSGSFAERVKADSDYHRGVLKLLGAL